MVLPGRVVSCGLCRYACPWPGTPFEFHASPLPYFRIFFILPRLLAIITLSIVAGLVTATGPDLNIRNRTQGFTR